MSPAQTLAIRLTLANMETDQLLSTIRGEIAVAIQKNVNGKIDKQSQLLGETIATMNNMRQEITMHNDLHNKDMERMMPIIEAFEETQSDLRVMKKQGRFVLWVAATVSALGGAVYIVMRILGK